MTDTELIEKVAKWCGIDEITPWQDLWEDYNEYREQQLFHHGKVKYSEEDFNNKTLPFDPLHDWNDLWDLVVPKLPDDRMIQTWNKSFTLYNLSNHKKNIKGNLPDLPRAILELIAEMEVK